MDNEKAKEKSYQYKILTEMWAWKDLMAWAESEKARQLNDLLHMAPEMMTPQSISHIAGFVRAIDALNQQISYVIESPLAGKEKK